MLWIDTMVSYEVFISPLVSISYLILQYISDWIFYSKRYKARSPSGSAVNKRDDLRSTNYSSDQDFNKVTDYPGSML